MAGAALVALAVTSFQAHAQAMPRDWPNRPIMVVVPSPAGGPPDLIIRMIGPKLAAALGQPIVVENRAGAGGVVGTAYLAKQPPDGYNWLFTTASHTNIPPFSENVPYDPVRDFTHVTQAAQNFGQVLVVHTTLPVKSVAELIAMARKDPGRLTYASAGIGTASHIPAEVMKAVTGTDIMIVPYKGVAEVFSDLVGGRVDMFFVGTQIAQQYVQAGKLRALAVTSAKRSPVTPDLPTIAEEGFKGYDATPWWGIAGPGGIPRPLLARINTGVRTAMASSEMKERFAIQGIEIATGTPEAFLALVKAEIDRWAKIVKTAGIKAD
jgi:tripartite-type tricarboxylate transporter receptor subunit TctC